MWLPIAKEFEIKMEKAFRNCNFGCVYAKIVKAFAIIAVVLAQRTMPTALAVEYI